MAIIKLSYLLTRCLEFFSTIIASMGMRKKNVIDSSMSLVLKSVLPPTSSTAGGWIVNAP